MKRTPTIILGICSLLFYSASCSKLTMEYDEARNLEIQTIDFTELKRGEFTGYYAGGMYQWRENECLVIAEYQKLVHIQLLQSAAEYTSEFFGKTFTSIVAQGIYGGNKIVKYLDFVGRGLSFNMEKGWFHSDYYYPVKLNPIKQIMGRLFDFTTRKMPI